MPDHVPGTMPLSEAVERCRVMIRGGSKSFSAASKVFGAEKRDAAFLLYGWCRYCDDTIDSAPAGTSEAELLARLDDLRSRTRAAMAGESDDHPVFVAFRHLAARYAIPAHYPMELLEGMAMDIRRERYATLDALTLYCYRVAGVVGLMMSHVMGVSREEALENATHMGIAMQLTNISRDVIEDAAMGRVYLPLDWLHAAGVDADRIADLSQRAGVALVAKRVVEAAERYYRSGDAGLAYLSFRSACTIASARSVYSAIGHEVVRRGAGAWDERVWIKPGRKAILMLRAVTRVATSLPRRWLSPWRESALRSVYLFQAGGALADNKLLS